MITLSRILRRTRLKFGLAISMKICFRRVESLGNCCQVTWISSITQSSHKADYGALKLTGTNPAATRKKTTEVRDAKFRTAHFPSI